MACARPEPVKVEGARAAGRSVGPVGCASAGGDRHAARQMGDLSMTLITPVSCVEPTPSTT